MFEETTYEFPSGEYTVYVLELADQHYYVGRTAQSLMSRIRAHENGSGARWTQEHEPRGLIEVHENVAGSVERTVTLRLMKEYGWERVRGAGWTQVNRANPPKALG